MTIGPQQLWLGTSRTSQTVRFWIDTTTVHLSIAGGGSGPCRPRLSAVDLARLPPQRRPPGRTAPRRKRARCPGRDELRRSAAASQLRRYHLSRPAGRPGRLPAGRAASPHPPGRPGHARHHPGQRLWRTLPCAIPPGQRHRLQGVRLAGPDPLPQSRLAVQRKVSSRGGIQVAGQRIQVGFSHAGQIVTIEPGDTTAPGHRQQRRTDHDRPPHQHRRVSAGSRPAAPARLADLCPGGRARAHAGPSRSQRHSSSRCALRARHADSVAAPVSTGSCSGTRQQA